MYSDSYTHFPPGGGGIGSPAFPPMPRGEIPTPEETVHLLQTQAASLTQLDAENKFCKVRHHLHSTYSGKLMGKVHGSYNENRASTLWYM